MKKGKELKKYLSVSQVSKMLKMSRQGVVYLIDNDQIKNVYYVDNYYLIPKKSIYDLLEERRHIVDGRYKVV